MYVFDVSLDTELRDVVGLFYKSDSPNISMCEDCGEYTVTIDGKVFRMRFDDETYSVIPLAHKRGRLSKIALYDALAGFTGRKMPWGALTGVRPTKLFYECLRTGKTPTEAVSVMQQVYHVSSERADVLKRITDAQTGKIEFPSDYVNLYVHIPYCTTRCSYCSFVSLPIAKCAAQAHDYVKYLCDEIKRSVEFLRNRNKKILSIYIGGGTPTALDAADLDCVLDSIGPFDGEYTCEAGRPDTIDGNKADIMKAHGVSRVCVNPQTLSDRTLEAIGRRHTAEDFYRAYDTIKNRGFDVNCDLIAGLGDETAEEFKNGFDKIKMLRPENITVHTLSKKNGSGIRYEKGENLYAAEMVECALSGCGDYRPYYLYRQKRQAGNLENVGFSLVGKECVNNITTMEESVGVMACGAGAISKIISGGNITRFANMRDVPLYLNRYEEKLGSKFRAFEDAFSR